jgi:hypothetical protein
MALEPNLAVVVVMRIIMLAFFSTMLFTLWYTSFKRRYTDFKFLYFITFTAQTAAKIFDLYIYWLVGSFESVNSDPQYILLFKLRYLLMMGLIIPLFAMMIFIWFNERRKLQNILNGVFIITSTTLIIIGPNYQFFATLISVIAFPLMILSIITYINLHRNKRLPQFNSLLMAIAFMFYMVAQILRPILTTSEFAGNDTLFFIELMEAGIWLMMGLSFVIRPKYEMKQVQTIVV